MPYVTTDDDVQLYYEDAGSGDSVLFVHEFGGDHRSWEPQIRFFSRRYRCITYGARGYPPSEVPDEVTAYSQQRAVVDAINILDGLNIEQAHIVGLSMGRLHSAPSWTQLSPPRAVLGSRRLRLRCRKRTRGIFQGSITRSCPTI